jgi:hypothetical protein
MGRSLPRGVRRVSVVEGAGRAESGAVIEPKVPPNASLRKDKDRE